MASAVITMSDEALVEHVLSTNGNAALLFGAENLVKELALKRAYKTMALRLHPDKNTCTRAHEAFQVMQHTFEVALETLQSSVSAPVPPESGAPPSPNPSDGTRCSAWAPPPAPPPSWPPTTAAGADTRKATGVTCGGRSPDGGSQRMRNRPQSEQNTSLGHVFFEVPLPPDVFGEFTASNVPDWSGGHAADAHRGAGCQAPPPPPPPPPKRAKPLPAFDPSSGDSEMEDGGKRSPRGPWRHCEPKQGKKQRFPVERRAVRQQHRAKLVVSHRSLKQLFAEFNISDDEDEVLPVHGPVSKRPCSHAGEVFSNLEQRQEHFSNQKFPTATNTSSRVSTTVRCPLCGTGGFPAQMMSAVMCQNCRVRFVPAAGAMESAELHKISREKGGGVLRDEMCACGRAKKGMCFLCD